MPNFSARSVQHLDSNALTIDVEDYWSIFSRDWLGQDAEPSDAVIRNTEWFLETLEQHKTKATFFVLGEVAEKFPSLVRKISDSGHEIGTHGFTHKQIFKLSRDEFRKEISDSKKLLEDIKGSAVAGHRAAAFSIMPQTQWAFDVLAEEGFRYDSSVYPIAGGRYGWPGFSKDICKVTLPSGKSIIEVPMSTVTVLGKDMPAAGGGYIRHFPYAVTRCAIRRIQKSRPAIVYMHPYEIDTAPVNFELKQLSLKDRVRAVKFHLMQVRNRSTTGRKLVKLLSEFQFITISRLIETAFTE